MVPDIEWIETLVTLIRQDTGFGFRIVGGTEEGSQVGFDDCIKVYKCLLTVLLFLYSEIEYNCTKKKANENKSIKNIVVSRFRSVISFLVERPILITDSTPAI